MSLKFKNGEAYYYKVFQIFNLSVAVTLLPFGYLVLEKHSGNLTAIPLDSSVYWLIAVPAVASITALILWIRNKHQLGKTASQNMTTLRDKLSNYYYVLRDNYLLFGLVSLLAVVLLWATGSGIYIIVYVVVMILLSLNRPTLKLIVDDLKLNEEEEKLLANKETID